MKTYTKHHYQQTSLSFVQQLGGKLLQATRFILHLLWKSIVSIFRYLQRLYLRLPMRIHVGKYRIPRQWILYVFGSIVCFLLPIALLSLILPGKSRAAWYDNNWGYRKPITVTNSSGGTLTNYQVKITVNTASLIAASKMQSDCDDIRLTSIDGTTILNYWIETGTNACNTASTTIWVKVPSLTTSGTTLYLYYGYASATSVQSGANTFDFFDDFSGTFDTSKWTATGTKTQTGGEMVVNSGAVYSNSTVTASNQNEMFEMRSKWNPLIIGYAGLQTADTQSVQNSNAGNNKLSFLMSNAETPPVAWWKLDENTLTTANDSSGNSISGTLTNSPTWTTGKYGSALTFNGSNTYVSLGTNATIGSLTSNITVEGWINASDLTGVHRIFSTARINTANGFGFGTNGTGLRFTTFGVKDYNTTTITLSTGTWYHIAAVMDSSYAVSFYVNGVFQETITGTNPANANTDDRIQIGASTDNLSSTINEVFTGTIDDVKIYNYSRTVDQITEDMDQSLHLNSWAADATDTGNTTTAYWMLNDNTGTSATDSSGNADTGTLTNGPTWVTGHYSSAVQFDGVDDYISYPNTINFGTGDFSVGAWAKMNGAGGGSGAGNMIFSQRTDTTGNGQPVVDLGIAATTNYPFFIVRDSVGAQVTLSGTTALSVGTWYHIQGVRSGSNLYLYVNGSLAASTTITLTGNFSSGGSGVVYRFIGKERYSAAEKSLFNGIIDDVRVYTYARTPLQTLVDMYHGFYNLGAGDYQSDAAASTYAVSGFAYDSTTLHYFSDRSETGSYTTSTSYTPYLSLGHFMGSGAGTIDITDMTVDWVLARKYTVSEPTIALGTEEPKPTPTPSPTPVPSNPEAAAFWKFDEGYGDASTSTGPIGWWTLDENTGTSAGDSSGNSYTGTLTNTPAWVTGVYGSGLSFDGVSQYVDISNVALTGTFSTSFWYKTTNVAQTAGIILGESTGTAASGPKIGLVGGKFFARLISTPDSSTSLPTDTKWHFVTLTRDASNKVDLYIDGSAANRLFGDVAQSGTYTLSILGANGDGSQPFLGTLDDIKVYNYARSSTQIAEDMNRDVHSAGSQGSTYNGLNYGATWKTEDRCVSGKCLGFNGTTNYVTGSGPSLAATSFTISGWVYQNNAPSGNQVWFSAGSTLGTDTALHLRVYPDGTIRFAFYGDDLDTPAGTFTSGTWHYLSYTYNVTSNLKSIYMDGRLVASGTATNDYSGNTTYNIGKWVAYNSDQWNGSIDEVKIYTVERNSDQIKADYIQGSASRGSSVVQGAGNQSFLANGQVGYWKMDETGWTIDCSTGSVLDASGNNNNGASCPTSTGPAGGAVGKFGNGGSFDASNDTIKVTNTTSLSTPSNNQWTMAAWINPTSTSGTQEVIRKDSSSGGYFMRVNAGTLESLFNFTGGASQRSGGTITAGSWQHVVVTFDGKTRRHFINGLQVASFDDSTNGSLSFNTSDVYIGSNVGSAEFFNGKLDEVRMFNTALSADQVRSLYNWKAGPIGYWKMDENTGTVANDSSGYGNIGTLISSPTWTAGKYGQALTFNGTSSTVSVANEANFDFERTQPFSIAAWIKVTSYSGNPAIFTKMANSAPYTGYNFALNTLGQLNFLLLNTWTSNALAATSTNTITPNVWTHVLVTYDGSSSTSGVKFYINGQLDTTITTFNSLSATALNNVTPYIASRNNTAFFFPGNIDDLRVYNYVVTSGQATEIDNADHPLGGSPVGSQALYWGLDEGYGNTSASTGPVGYWKLNENTGTSAADSSGNSITGTLTNSPTWTTGVFGPGLTFNGTNSYVSLGTNATIGGLTSNLTVDAWIYPTDLTGTRRIFSTFRSSTANGIGFGILDSGLRFTTFGVKDYDSTTITLKTNTWYHVAAVMDSSYAVSFYVNGVFKEKVTGVSPGNANTDDTLMIGASTLTTTTTINEVFSGSIDEVKVYNYARTQGQIVEDMSRDVHNRGSGGGNFNAQNLGATWSTGSSCKVGGCLYFNGTSTAVTGNGPVLANSSFTISSWINETNAIFGSKGWILIGDDAGGNYISLRVNSTGKMTYSVTGSDLQSADGVFTKGVWHHVVYTYDQATKARKIYLDKQLVASDTAPADYLGNGTVFLGWDSGLVYWPGFIDEVKIYTAALTQDQVNIDYNAGASVNYGTGQIEAAQMTDGIGNPPIGYWNLDENRGTTANDTSGNGNNGTLMNSPSWTSGAVGSGISFDGSDDQVFVTANGTALDLDAATSVSVSAWVYARAYPSSCCTNIAGRDNGNNSEQYFLRLGETGTNNKLQWIIKDSSSVEHKLFTGTTIALNTWYHVEGTWDGTTQKIYLNGVLSNSQTASGISLVASGEAFTIGASTTPSRWFNGIIDDVKVYNYGRTASQVAYDYNRGGPIGWWKFDECSGTTIHDASGNTFDGTSTITATGGNTNGAGTCTTSASAWGSGATGKFNSGLYFDGNGDYINLFSSALASSFNGAQGTFAIWGKIDSAALTDGGVHYMGVFQVDGTNYVTIYKDTTNNRITFVYYAGGTAKVIFATLTNTNWNHYAITWDKTADQMKAYINGIQVGTTQTGLGTFTGTIVTAILSNGSTVSYPGILDDARLYGYALSASQILQVMNGTAVRFGPLTGSP